jgi:hypothetical protein
MALVPGISFITALVLRSWPAVRLRVEATQIGPPEYTTDVTEKLAQMVFACRG